MSQPILDRNEERIIMPELTDHTKIRIFEKLDDLDDKIGDVSERLARVEENQKSHYRDNDQQHNTMVSNIAEVKESVSEFAERLDEVESILDQRAGQHGVFGNIWQLVLALVGGGILVTVGGIIAKAIGIFG